jgi:dienelactone hydrolase
VSDALNDFERSDFSHGGKTRTVFRTGSGPAVIVLSEMPGITPAVADFARRVAGLGCTAVLPHLFGEPGADISVPLFLKTMPPLCVSREFGALVAGKTAPVTQWLRALARAEHERCGGPGVGVVGMCFTGNFALAMAVDPSVAAPVMSQPSMPILAMTEKRKRDLAMSPQDLETVKQRVADDNLCVIGLRFTGDSFVPEDRFERLRQELGDGFVAVEIDSSPGNAHGFKKTAHSVLTEELVDEPGHPTRDALDKVLDLFKTKLLAPA